MIIIHRSRIFANIRSLFAYTYHPKLKSHRPPLYNPSLTADADMLWPKLPSRPGITMAKRLTRKEFSGNGSGIIYDVHVSNAICYYSRPANLSPITNTSNCNYAVLGTGLKWGILAIVQKRVNFKTGPSFSFGKGRSDRFGPINHLPEADDWALHRPTNIREPGIAEGSLERYGRSVLCLYLQKDWLA
jgi:hypothetical protein